MYFSGTFKAKIWQKLKENLGAREKFVTWHALIDFLIKTVWLEELMDSFICEKIQYYKKL